MTGTPIQLMIGHQAKTMDLPAGLLARLLQRGKETLAIGVVLENRFLVVITVHEVVDRARVFEA